jgi:hypothetical protein
MLREAMVLGRETAEFGVFEGYGILYSGVESGLPLTKGRRKGATKWNDGYMMKDTTPYLD